MWSNWLTPNGLRRYLDPKLGPVNNFVLDYFKITDDRKAFIKSYWVSDPYRYGFIIGYLGEYTRSLGMRASAEKIARLITDMVGKIPSAALDTQEFESGFHVGRLFFRSQYTSLSREDLANPIMVKVDQMQKRLPEADRMAVRWASFLQFGLIARF